MKKFVPLVIALALSLSVITPAFAAGGPPLPNQGTSNAGYHIGGTIAKDLPVDFSHMIEALPDFIPIVG